jgi:hypothetical protein
MLFSSLYSLLLTRPSGRRTDSPWQKEADILMDAIVRDLHQNAGSASGKR